MNRKDLIQDHSIAEPNTGCWLWERGMTTAGYGITRLTGKLEYAHRISYEAFVGPIPSDCEIDHKCRQRGCVNPAHLEAVTHHENVKRGGAATRSRRPFCGRGHSFEDAYIRPNGSRVCRSCLAIRMKRYGQKKRASK